MTVSALIFDVDGTMADTEEAHRCAFNGAFAEFGLDWHWSREAYRDLLTTAGGKERLARYVAQLTPDAAGRKRLEALIPALHARKTRLYGEALAGGAVVLRDGVARLIDEAGAAGCHLAIASTTTAANVDALLASCLGRRGLDLFSVIVCGDQVRAKKPAPDVYQMALRHLGIDCRDAIALEDSFNGLRSASAAGIWTVVTPTYWSAGDTFTGAGMVLEHLGDAQHPIPGEPGNALQMAPWLTLAEIGMRHAATVQ